MILWVYFDEVEFGWHAYAPVVISARLELGMPIHVSSLLFLVGRSMPLANGSLVSPVLLSEGSRTGTCLYF